MSADHIFLSYAKEDVGRVRTVHARLRRDGFRLWLDEHNLLPGQDWDTAIREAIRTSKVFIVFLSENAVTKTGYIQKEIREALQVTELQPEGQVFIVPVRLTDCAVPERLRKWQWIDLFDRRGYDQLLRGLTAHLGVEVRATSVSRALRGRRLASSTDHLLYDLFLESDRLLHTKLPDGRVALGQGHFFVIRSDFPRTFRNLKRQIGDFRQINAEKVTHLLPPDAPWRRVEARVRRTAYVDNTSIIVTATKETIAGVYLGYWTCANALGERGRIYISSETTPFYVEDSSKRVVMVIAPSRLTEDQRALLSQDPGRPTLV